MYRGLSRDRVSPAFALPPVPVRAIHSEGGTQRSSLNAVKLSGRCRGQVRDAVWTAAGLSFSRTPILEVYCPKSPQQSTRNGRCVTSARSVALGRRRRPDGGFGFGAQL